MNQSASFEERNRDAALGHSLFRNSELRREAHLRTLCVRKELEVLEKVESDDLSMFILTGFERTLTDIFMAVAENPQSLLSLKPPERVIEPFMKPLVALQYARTLRKRQLGDTKHVSFTGISEDVDDDHLDESISSPVSISLSLPPLTRKIALGELPPIRTHTEFLLRETLRSVLQTVAAVTASHFADVSKKSADLEISSCQAEAQHRRLLAQSVDELVGCREKILNLENRIAEMAAERETHAKQQSNIMRVLGRSGNGTQPHSSALVEKEFSKLDVVTARLVDRLVADRLLAALSGGKGVEMLEEHISRLNNMIEEGKDERAALARVLDRAGSEIKLLKKKVHELEVQLEYRHKELAELRFSGWGIGAEGGLNTPTTAVPVKKSVKPGNFLDISSPTVGEKKITHHSSALVQDGIAGKIELSRKRSREVSGEVSGEGSGGASGEGSGEGSGKGSAAASGESNSMIQVLNYSDGKNEDQTRSVNILEVVSESINPKSVLADFADMFSNFQVYDDKVTEAESGLVDSVELNALKLNYEILPHVEYVEDGIVSSDLQRVNHVDGSSSPSNPLLEIFNVDLFHFNTQNSTEIDDSVNMEKQPVHQQRQSQVLEMIPENDKTELVQLHVPRRLILSSESFSDLPNIEKKFPGLSIAVQTIKSSTIDCQNELEGLDSLGEISRSVREVTKSVYNPRRGTPKISESLALRSRGVSDWIARHRPRNFQVANGIRRLVVGGDSQNNQRSSSQTAEKPIPESLKKSTLNKSVINETVAKENSQGILKSRLNDQTVKSLNVASFSLPILSENKFPGPSIRRGIRAPAGSWR